MRLEEAKTRYQGEWIAFRPFDESDNPEGEVILHHRDRRTFDKELVEGGMTGVYITFAGPPVPEGYAVMFQTGMAMRLPLSIPLVVRNVRVTGPRGMVRVDLVLDTGAAFVALSWPVLKTIGYDPAVAPERQEIITANGIIEVPKLRGESIGLGDAEVKGVEVICHDIPELAGLRGLLGLSFLRHFRTVIDYREGYLEIS